MEENEDRVAIVGISCTFPGANNIHEYWELLKNGENHVREVPAERWDVDAFYDEDPHAPGKTYARTAGFVDNSRVFQWDYRAFNISEEEAVKVDPQQRMVLECVHDALLDAGIRAQDINGKNVGVFIGCMTDDYKSHVMDDDGGDDTFAVTGTHNSLISARVSYVYHLTGKSKTIDTACSSSIVAIDDAIEALKSGSISAAICGGVNLLLDPQLFIALSKAGMLSPTGQCRAFTNQADGYVRGEGCGVVIIKRLSEAIRDGNKIWGIIATATNQDGRAENPITAPSSTQQLNLLKTIYPTNKVDRAAVQVVECHGTGTVIGDPAEVEALGMFFEGNNKQRYLGSVKTNIGHLEAAAGMAGLIKILLMIRHKTIVPSLWYTKENENPKLKLDKHHFTVPVECTDWKTDNDETRTAGISGFGFGGTNAHAIVQEYKMPESNGHQLELPIFVLTALDENTLRKDVAHLCDRLETQTYNMSDVACTSTCKRTHRPYREAFVAETQNDLRNQCRAYLDRPIGIDRFGKSNVITLSTRKSQRVCFVYSGMGTSWKGMFRDLLVYDAFRKTILEVDNLLARNVDWRVLAVLENPDEDIIGNVVKEPVVMFACQVALTELYKAVGVHPNVVVGQSVGEVAGAYCSGILDVETATKVIVTRSILISRAQKGGMAIIQNVPTEEVERFCQDTRTLTVAVFISSKACSVSGDEAELDELIERFSIPERNGSKNNKLLNVPCAYHHNDMREIATDLEEELGHLNCHEAEVKFISTVGTIETLEIGSSGYWKQHMIKPVLFKDAVKKAEDEYGCNIFIEIGPNPVLSPHIKDIFQEDSEVECLASVLKNDNRKQLANALCFLFTQGINVNWNLIHRCSTLVTDIPTQHLRRLGQLYQSPSTLKRLHGTPSGDSSHPFMKTLPMNKGLYHFEVTVSPTQTPYVYQHKVKDIILLPGAVHSEIAFAVGKMMFSEHETNTGLIGSVEFLRPIVIAGDSRKLLRVVPTKREGSVTFSVKDGLDVCCRGVVSHASVDEMFPERLDIPHLKLSITSSESVKSMTKNDIYDQLQRLGFEHGPCYQVLGKSLTTGEEALTIVDVQEDLLMESKKMTIHPVIIDAMMQSTVATTSPELLRRVDEEKLIFLPTNLEKIFVYRRPEREMFIFTKRYNTVILETVLQMHFNIVLLCKNGTRIAEIQNYMTYSKRGGQHAPCDLSYEIVWHRVHSTQSIESKTEERGGILVFGLGMHEDDRNCLESMSSCEKIEIANTTYAQENEAGVISKWMLKLQDNNPCRKDAIIFFVKGQSPTRIENEDETKNLSEHVIISCVLLKELLVAMIENGMEIPLYVVTENTQGTFDSGEELSLHGPALWGFIRSVHFEFSRCDITLVDLLPSLKQTAHRLVSFVRSTCSRMSETRPEIVITEHGMYSSSFTKTVKSRPIPLQRTNKRTLEPTGYFDVTSRKVAKMTSAFLTARDNEFEIETENDSEVNLQLKCFVLPQFLVQTTFSGNGLGVWDIPTEAGRHVTALEFTGTIRSSGSSLGHTDVDSKLAVALYPSRLSTSVRVPRKFIADVDELPIYTPGLLTYSMLLWAVVQKLPRDTSVVLYSTNATDLLTTLVTTMMKSQRNANVYIASDPCDFSQGQRETTLVALGSVENILPLIKCMKTVICVQGNVNHDVKDVYPHIEFKIIRPTKVFQEARIAAELPRVLTWTKEHVQKLIASGEINRNMHLPCECKEVAQLPLQRPLNNLFCRDGVYIVTGGLTGLGWQIVNLLAEMGAGSVVCMSRRDFSEDYSQQIHDLVTRLSCRVRFVKGDVNDIQSLREAFNEIKDSEGMRKIKGIFHGAGVLGGRVLTQLEETQIRDVLNPKVLGTLNLHIVEQELGLNLDLFICASSISSYIGSPGQSNYGAANAFMDAFITWRRLRGFCGQVINWGALSVGMASQKAFSDNFEKRGYRLLSIPEIRTALIEALLKDSSDTIYTDVDWDTAVKDFVTDQMRRVRYQVEEVLEQFARPIENETIQSREINIKALHGESKAIQKEAVGKLVLGIYSRVSPNEDIHDINCPHSLGELGIDSVTLTMFSNIIKQQTDHRIDKAFLFDTSHTLLDITNHLHQQLFNSAEEN